MTLRTVIRETYVRSTASPLEKKESRGLTLLARLGITKLLNAAPDLLGCPTDLGRVVDIVRDKLVPHRETSQRTGRLGLGGLVLFQTCHARTSAFSLGRRDVMKQREGAADLR